MSLSSSDRRPVELPLKFAQGLGVVEIGDYAMYYVTFDTFCTCLTCGFHWPPFLFPRALHSLEVVFALSGFWSYVVKNEARQVKVADVGTKVGEVQDLDLVNGFWLVL